MTILNPGCLGALLRLFVPKTKQDDDLSAPTIQFAPPEIYPYRVQVDFLSPAESSFYQVLKSMLGKRLVICPKVSLAEIFFVAQSNSRQAYENKINRKRIDFLLCQLQTLKPVLAIELDDFQSPAHRLPGTGRLHRESLCRGQAAVGARAGTDQLQYAGTGVSVPGGDADSATWR